MLFFCSNNLLGDMRLLSLFRNDEPKRDPLDPRFWSELGLKVGGQIVTPVRAEQIAAVYACKTAIAESVSMLPCSVYSEDERTKTREKEHPLHRLLRDAPNPWMDSFEFFEVCATAMLDTGNFYAHVKRNRAGAILQLTPMDATKTTPKMRPGNVLIYEHTTPDGEKKEYYPDEVFHVKYRSKDGLKGRTPIQVASESIGYSLALQEHGIKTFQNGAFLSGFLSAPMPFKDDEQRKNFMKSFRDAIGAQNAGKFGLLEQGVEFKPYSQNNKDAEFLGQKQFNVVEIARIYRMPPHMIQELSKGASYSSIEQMAIAFVQYTIQPWVTRLERAIKRQLLNGFGEESMFLRFNIAALIRGDLLSRTTSVVQQLQAGLKTINEGRNLLDENAINDPIGDEVLLSHNLRPASQVLAEPTQAVPAQVEEPKAPKAEDKPSTVDDSEEDIERFSPLIEELWGRIIRREQKLIEGARRKPDFHQWACEWLADHRGFVSQTFAAMIKALPTRVNADEFFDAYLHARETQILVNGDYASVDIGATTRGMINFIKRCAKCPVK